MLGRVVEAGRPVEGSLAVSTEQPVRGSSIRGEHDRIGFEDLAALRGHGPRGDLTCGNPGPHGAAWKAAGEMLSDRSHAARRKRR
jgi:hypothetical protein